MTVIQVHVKCPDVITNKSGLFSFSSCCGVPGIISEEVSEEEASESERFGIYCVLMFKRERRKKE